MCESDQGKTLTRKDKVFKLVHCDSSLFPISLFGKLSRGLLLMRKMILGKLYFQIF